MSVEKKALSVDKRLTRIIWLLNKGCNLKCRFCYVADRFDKGRELSLSEILKALDEVIELGVKRIDFTGGEVLLRDDLPILLEETKRRGIDRVTINTNGTLLNEGILELLAKNDIEVYLSIDGARRETHEIIRGVGTWDKVLHAANMLSSFGIRFYTVFACSKINANEVEDYILLSRDLGSSKACIIPVLPVGRARKDAILSQDELVEVLYRIDKTADSSRMVTELWCTPFAGLIVSSPYVSYFGCRSMDEIDITPNGDVLVCDTLDIPIGNIKDGVANVWENFLHSELTSGLLETMYYPPCNLCEIRDICRGGCYVRSRLLKGDIFSPDPLCPRVVSY